MLMSEKDRQRAAVRKIKVTVKNRLDFKVWARLNKGGDGGGQTQFFGIPKGDSEEWMRAPPGSSLTLVVSTTKDNSGKFIHHDFKLPGVDKTFILEDGKVK
jgi:hypothetical protein